MKHPRRPILLALSCTLALAACGNDAPPAPPAAETKPAPAAAPRPPSWAEQHAGELAPVRLSADLSRFSDNQRKMLAKLVRAAELMNPIFWKQWYGDRAELMAKIKDEPTRRYAEMNFGPWDRLHDDAPFVDGAGAHPPGAQFYPADMTKDEFEAATLPDKDSHYTLLRRDGAGKLVTVPYHEAYKAELEPVAALLREAAALAEDKGFANYLQMRAKALLDDDFQRSDMAWMDMKTNPVDVVIGPIESYDDAIYNNKASYEGLVLVKDLDWSKRLARFTGFLPELQKNLPVAAKYKAEKPGAKADLNAYFVLYYGGNANAGAKTIAINLPNDEEVQLKKGSRRLQLENVMQAKFDKILMPIAQQVIAADQLANVTFDAFFQDVMFHEVAHGLGIKNTLDGKGTVRAALKDQASSYEEGKADILGLYMVTQLAQKGELDKGKLMDNYVTFIASIVRSVRFGAGDAHGKANMVCFNFFQDQGAFARGDDGKYRVDFDKTQQAMAALSAKILTLQGDGDYDGARKLNDEMGVIRPQLEQDLKRIAEAKVPIDVSFEQGLDVLGLDDGAK
jgi:hypothetical protein